MAAQPEDAAGVQAFDRGHGSCRRDRKLGVLMRQPPAAKPVPLGSDRIGHGVGARSSACV
jgi:hypothetical protein